MGNKISGCGPHNCQIVSRNEDGFIDDIESVKRKVLLRIRIYPNQTKRIYYARFEEDPTLSLQVEIDSDPRLSKARDGELFLIELPLKLKVSGATSSIYYDYRGPSSKYIFKRLVYKIFDREGYFKQETSVFELLKLDNSTGSPESDCLKLLRKFSILTPIGKIIREGKKNILVFPYCKDTNLLNLYTIPNITIRIITTIIKDLMISIQYIHSKNIVHMDLKPDNIFLSCVDDTFKGRSYLSDFGHSVNLDSRDFSTLNHWRGTRRYLDPGSFQLDSNHSYGNKSMNVSKKTDIWSLGLVILFILTGREVIWNKGDRESHEPWFFGKDTSYIIKKVEGQLTEFTKLTLNYTLQWRIITELIPDMLKIQHDDRPDIEQCLDQFNILVQDSEDSEDYRSDNKIYHSSNTVLNLLEEQDSSQDTSVRYSSGGGIDQPNYLNYRKEYLEYKKRYLLKKKQQHTRSRNLS